MKRMAIAAVAALALLFFSGEAKANGFTFNPGHITLQGGLSLSWGGGGWTCGGNNNNCAPGYGGPPAAYNAYPAYGYPAYGYGHGYGYPMGYGYGY